MAAALRLPGLLPPMAVPTAHARQGALPPRSQAMEELRRMGLVADARTKPGDPLAWLSLSTDVRDTDLSGRIA